MIESDAMERRVGGKIEEQGLLFDATAKFLLLAAFLELVLYRLVSRLGMHLSKLASEHDWIRVTFKILSSVGFTLLNVVSLLVFLALFLVLLDKARGVESGRFDTWVVPTASLLLLLTAAYLFFPPAMLGAVVYNAVFWLVLLILGVEYCTALRPWSQRTMMLVYLLGISGWLYYQVVSTTFGLLNLAQAPPLVHEVNRLGEALMVLASILVFWAYGGVSLKTKNRRQRHRMAIFATAAAIAFLLLLFMDYLAAWYDQGIADSLRRASQGIGWIFQMGMGYTFYLPFALYVVGLLCWAYTVIKLLTMGRQEGIGIGLMFLAGYALQLSHLSLMVVLGVLLLTLEKRRVTIPSGARVEQPLLPGRADPSFGQQTS